MARRFERLLAADLDESQQRLDHLERCRRAAPIRAKRNSAPEAVQCSRQAKALARACAYGHGDQSVESHGNGARDLPQLTE